MPTPTNRSLTGSPSGAPPSHAPSVSLALGRLRSGVNLCGWIVGVALLVQLVIWGLATYTDLRWTELRTAEQPAVIIYRSEAQPRRIRSPLDEARAESAPPPPNPNRVLGTLDRMFAAAASLAAGLGTVGVLLLVPLTGLGVLLGVSSATNGVERVVSAFGWSVMTLLLALPFGSVIGLPWPDGAFWEYAPLCRLIDGTGGAVSPLDATFAAQLVFYTRFLILPLTCMVSAVLVVTFFSAGIEAGLLRKELLVLDEELELEAANIKPGTLHGGRTAGAMDRAVGPAAAPGALPGGTVRQLTPGTAPRRLV